MREKNKKILLANVNNLCSTFWYVSRCSRIKSEQKVINVIMS